jgi:lysophospholipase L1-like esterase
MRKHTALAVLALVTSLLTGIGPATAGGHLGRTHLALGDSVAAGTQQPLPFTDNAYTDQLFKDLESEHGFNSLVKLACPGDDTTEMRFGTGGASPGGSACYGPNAVLPPGGTSQLDAAVSYLLAHPGEVGLITITIGANDVLVCDPTDPAVQVCLATQLGLIATNLPVILGTLQAVAPGVPIVGMNYYNPNLAFWLVDPSSIDANLALSAVFNGTLEAVYGAVGVPVADVATAFRTFKTNGKQVPTNVRAVCAYTRMCEKEGNVYVLSDWDPGRPGPQTDIHPSNKGYKKIASTFHELIDSLDLLT